MCYCVRKDKLSRKAQSNDTYFHIRWDVAYTTLWLSRMIFTTIFIIFICTIISQYKERRLHLL